MHLFHKIIGLLSLLLITGVAFATPINPTLSVIDAEKKLLHFEAGNFVTSAMEIRLQDEQGEVLFSEYVVDPGSFVRHYNLSELPNGLYLLLVEGDEKTVELPIRIDSNLLRIEQGFRYLE